MKQVFTLEATTEADSGVLLLSVAMVLCEYRLSVDSLVWSSFKAKNVIRLWLVVDEAEETVNALAERCRDLPSVQYFSQEAAGQSSHVLDRIHELDSRWPFPNDGARCADTSDSSNALPDKAANSSERDPGAEVMD